MLHRSEKFVSTLTVTVRAVYGNRVLCLCDYSVVFVKKSKKKHNLIVGEIATVE